MSDLEDNGVKYGRVRKKSAKLLEMEEFEEAEKKAFTKKGSADASKAAKHVASTPSPTAAPPAKKLKIKVEKGESSPTPAAKSAPLTPTPAAKSAPLTPPHAKLSPQSSVKAEKTPSSVIKFLLSSPAVPTTPSVSTKAVTKTSPNSEQSPPTVSPAPHVKKSKAKVKLEAAMSMDDEPSEADLPETVLPKQEVDVKPKALLSPSPTPIITPPSASSKPIDAAGSMDSLKMKLFLSPKEKKPMASFEQMLESGNEAVVTKTIKKKKKKAETPAAKEPSLAFEKNTLPSVPGKGQTATEAMPNLAALVTSGKKKASSKKKAKPAPAPHPLPARVGSLTPELGTSSSKLSDSPIDVEFEPNLVIADDTEKVKHKKKLSAGKSKKKATLGSSSVSAPEGDIAALAAKVKVGDKKGKKKDKDDTELLGKKRKRPPTAYTLYCNAHRAKLVSENPGIDFAQISRRLGEMWQTLTKKEKWCWRRKAKKMAGKGSTLISTGKVNKPKPTAPAPVAPAAPAPPSLPVAKPMVPHQGARIAKATSTEESALSPIKGFGTEPVDVAAHLKLLGESLSIIGMRLQEHKGLIAVQGSMSVLLDSLLCSFGPLMCLTEQVSELHGCTHYTHAKTLDNIAYVMPGL